MPYDFKSPRLLVETDLQAGAEIEAERDQANYLLNVLRLAAGDRVLLFNGRDGEWRAEVAEAGRKRCLLLVAEQTRTQPYPTDLHYLFAPLKHARLDYMIQKAVEMGCSRLRPVITRYSQASRVNLERMRANAIEAAEQCGVLAVPAIDPPGRLTDVLAGWDPARRLVFCDEGTARRSPLAALAEQDAGPLAVLIGPEGGFAPEERDALVLRPYVIPLSLGPRILRADTAAVAALALVQASLGDWR